MKLPQTRRFSELMPVAWQNGGGVTREVARQEPDGESPGWRVSIAELDRPGPFSVMAGVRRHFTVIGANPVTLVVAGQEVILASLESLVFDGEAAVSCLLPEGPSRALNLMYNPHHWQAHVDWLTPGEPLSPPPNSETLIVAVGERAWLAGKPSLYLESCDVWYWPGVGQRLNSPGTPIVKPGVEPVVQPVINSSNTMIFETLPATRLLRIDLSPRG